MGCWLDANKQNVTISVDNATYEVVYECDAGFAFPDGEICRRWSCECSVPSLYGGLNQTCKEIMCDSLPDHLTTNASATPVMDNSTYMYHCAEENHAFSNLEYERPMQCSVNDSIPGRRVAQWLYDESDTSCHEVQCPLAISDGTRIVSNRSTHSCNTYTNISCAAGYYFDVFNDTTIDLVTVFCHVILTHNVFQTYWDPVPVNCSLMSCDPPTIDLDTGTIIGSDYLVNSSIDVKCHPGYVLPNSTDAEQTSVCSGNQHDPKVVTWLPSVPASCEELMCDTPVPPENATMVTNIAGASFPVNSTVEVQCNTGFITSSADVIFNQTCSLMNESSVQWTSDDGCQVVNCPAPPSIDNGVFVANISQLNTTATLLCDAGYTLSDESYLGAICVLNQSDYTRAYWNSSDEISCNLDTTIEPTTETIPTTSTEMSTLLTTTNRVLTTTNEDGSTAPTDVSTITIQDTTIETEKTSETTSLILTTTSDYEQTTSKAFVPTDDSSEATTFNTTANSAPSVATSEAPTTQALQTEMTVTTEEGVMTNPTDDASSTAETTPASVATNDSTDTNPAPSVAIPEVPTTQVVHAQPTQDPLNPVIECEAPKELEHATLLTYGLKIGVIVTYHSHTFYSFADGSTVRTIECNPGGIWSIEVDEPTRTECQAAPDFSEESIFGIKDSLGVGTQVRYVCNEGEQLRSGIQTKTIECGGLGKWNEEDDQCAKRCGPVPYLDDADVMHSINTVTGSVNLRCHWGYLLEDGAKEQRITCVDNHWQWPAKCHRTSCGSLGLPSNGSLSTDLTLSGTEVIARCDEGFWFENNSTEHVLFCDEYRQWNGTVTDCKVIDCGRPATVSNCTQTGPAATFYNRTAVYTCDDDYRHEDGYHEKTIRCTGSGLWSETRMSCGPGRCPPIPEIEKAEVDTRSAMDGSVVTYTCQHGYEFLDESFNYVIKCKNARWNYTDTACIPIQCPLPTHTNTTYFSSQNNRLGSVIQMTCAYGHRIQTTNQTASTECQGNKTWSTDLDSCQLVQCGDPPSVLNSQRSALYSSHYASSLAYTCLPGFWFTRHVLQETVTCDDSAEWRPFIDDCTAVHCPFLPYWDGKLCNTTGLEPGDFANCSCNEETMFPGRELYIEAECTASGDWAPLIPDCIDKVAYMFNPQPSESTGARLIGLVAMSIIISIFGIIIVSDIPHLLRAYRMLRMNIQHFRESGMK